MKFYFTIFLFFMAPVGFAQSMADSVVSPLKTMGYKQYNAYLNGEDLHGMDLAATLNHYPSPAQVIVLKKQLALTPKQFAEVNMINTELMRKKKEMGRSIIKNERMLDSLFRIKQIDDGTLIFYTNRYGLYQGELRNAILQAYLKMVDILTTEQFKKCTELVKAEHP